LFAVRFGGAIDEKFRSFAVAAGAAFSPAPTLVLEIELPIPCYKMEVGHPTGARGMSAISVAAVLYVHITQTSGPAL
jgi:hypothetical protein